MPFTDDESTLLLASVPVEMRTQSWWLILPGSPPIAGNRGGGIALLGAMGLTRFAGRGLAALHLSRLVDALDDFVAARRKRLSRLVPKGPAPHRYP